MKHDHTTIQFPLPLDGAYIEVPIARGYRTLVDAIDADIANLRLTLNFGVSSGPYAQWNRRTEKGWRAFRVHRMIMERVLGRPLLADEHVDHANGNPLDNRRANLRLCDWSTNAVNSKRRSDNKSGYKGVCFHPFSGLWRAYIRANGKQVSLGYYHSPEEAHEAYKEAAVTFYGEFARFE